MLGLGIQVSQAAINTTVKVKLQIRADVGEIAAAVFSFYGDRFTYRHEQTLVTQSQVCYWYFQMQNLALLPSMCTHTRNFVSVLRCKPCRRVKG